MSSWVPTRKWISGQVVLVGGLAVHFVTKGNWDPTLSVEAIGIAVGAITTYLIPNAPTTAAEPDSALPATPPTEEN